MTDKLVSYADLPELRRIMEAVGHSGCGPLVQRLIAAAEADQPPLPEGWYLFTDKDGTCSAWHLPARGSDLTQYDDGSGSTALSLAEARADLTPLRPTVTAADVERAARGAWNAMARHATWEALTHGEQAALIRAQRAAFRAAGIEVQP